MNDLKRIFSILLLQSLNLFSHGLNILEDSPRFYTQYDNCSMDSNGESAVMRSLITPNTIVFDVGANSGEWSERALKQNPHIIFAFEPISEFAQKCTQKFTHANVRVFNLALSDTTQPQEFFYYDTKADYSRLSGLFYRPILETLIPAAPKKIIVNTTTIDQFCADQHIERINFLKIDTEGAEMNVIKGALDSIRTGKIDFIQFEYGGTYKDANITLKAVYDILKSHNYKIYRIVSEGLVYIPFWRDSLENYRYSNFIASKEKL